MNASIRVADLMTPDPKCIYLTEGLEKAEYFFKTLKIRHLPVLNGEKIVGMLSNTDLQRISFVDSYNPKDFGVDRSIYAFFSLEQVMAHHPRCIKPKLSIKKAAQIFLEEKFHALPVVKKKKLVGMLSTSDLLRHAYALKRN